MDRVIDSMWKRPAPRSIVPADPDTELADCIAALEMLTTHAAAEEGYNYPRSPANVTLKFLRELQHLRATFGMSARGAAPDT